MIYRGSCWEDSCQGHMGGESCWERFGLEASTALDKLIEEEIQAEKQRVIKKAEKIKEKKRKK